MSDKIILKWEQGHPGGWVNDLSLFSDSTLWLNKRYPGWYGKIPNKLLKDVELWCNKNLQHQWSIRFNELLIRDKRDLIIFILRWS